MLCLTKHAYLLHIPIILSVFMTKRYLQSGHFHEFEPGREKTCLISYANNKGADQPAHPRSLISAFAVRCLDSVMSLVSVTKFQASC